MSASDGLYYDVHASHALDSSPTHALCVVTSNMRLFVSLFPYLTCRALVSLLRDILLPALLGVLGPGHALCLNLRCCSRPTMRHIRQYVILPLQAGSFPLIFLTGIPDVSQVRQRTDVVTSIIGASEVDVDVCGRWLASRILAVWPDKLRPPLRLCFEIHMDSKLLSGGERSHTACVECAISVCNTGA